MRNIIVIGLQRCSKIVIGSQSVTDNCWMAELVMHSALFFSTSICFF